MKKGVIILFLCIFVGIFLVSVVSAFNVNFEEPTPSNGETNSSIITNVSTDATSDTYTFLDWNKSLVSWWTMESMSGDIIYDNSTYENSLTRTGTSGAKPSQTINGYWGNGMLFGDSGSNERLQSTTYGDELEFGENRKFTISTWINPRVFVSGSGIVNKRSTYGFTFGLHSDGKLRGYIAGTEGNSGNFYSSTVLQVNNWYNVIMVSDGNTVRFYINGTEDLITGDISSVGNISDTSATLYVGFQSSSFNGSMDDILVFNRALNETEILALYNSSANRYYNDFSSIGTGGLSYNYTAYVTNKSGIFNSSETRTFIFSKSINSINSPIYSDRDYLTGINLSITTNFDASCIWSNNSFSTNYSMSSIDNRNFNSTNVTLPEGATIIDFYCNDSSDSAISQMNFTFVDHLTYYVDNSSSFCSDSYSKNYATNSATPFCTINNGALSSGVQAGDEIVVKYAGGLAYCEGINVGTVGISGTENDPILIRGENDSSRTFLNGSCASEASGVILTGEDFWTFRYFDIYNFSLDGLNVHADGADNSVNITFENITTRAEGKSGGNDDGVSFHEGSEGVGRWLNISGAPDTGIIDVQDSNTNYYDSEIRDSSIGIHMTGTGKHELERISVMDSAYCFRADTTVNSTVRNLTCINNSAYQIYANQGGIIRIIGFNVSQTPSGSYAVRAYNATSSTIFELIDGQLDGSILIEQGGRITLANVTYNLSNETFANNGGNLTRKWYLDASSNIENTNITITNSTGEVIYSNLTSSIPKQTLTSYINDGGTRTYYSNYTITATKSGYVTSTQTINLTDNTNIEFVLVAETSTTGSDTTTSSSGGLPTYTITQSNLQEGYSKILGKNWKLKFNFENETHELKVDDIQNTSAKITTSSNPITFNLSINQTKKIDLDDDGFYDFSVLLKNIAGNSYYRRAEVYIKSINEEIQNYSNTTNEENNSNENSNQQETISENIKDNKLIYLIVGIILVAIVITLLTLKFKLKPKKKRK